MKTKNRILDYSITEFVYLFSLSIFMIYFLVRNTTVIGINFNNTLDSFVRTFCIILLAIKTVIDLSDISKMKNIEIWRILFLVIGLVTNLYSSMPLLIDLILFIVAGYGIDFATILSTYKKIFIFIVPVIVALSLVGVIENKVFVQGERVRYSFGFNYSSFLPQLYFFITIAVITYKKKYQNIIYILIFSVINFLIYRYSDTKFPFYLTEAYLLIILIKNYKNIRNINNILIYILSFIFPIMLSLVTYFSANYNGSGFGQFLNDITTGRIQLGNYALNEYGVPLLGQKITLIGNLSAENRGVFDVYNYIDSGLLQSLILNGVIFTCFIVIGFTIKLLQAKKNNNIDLFIALFFIGLQSVFDPQLFQLYYSPFILAIGTITKYNTNNYNEV